MIQLACALLAALTCAPASTDVVRVDGLQEGESYTLLAPGPGPSDDYAHGRVVDAFTGAPLPGATIELWSEEIDEQYGGFHRFGSATSGRDGRFRVRCREGAQRAEKLRASAPGYLVYTETAAQAREVITLFPAEPTAPRIRFTDLQGRPIEGARVTSTYTCAHDLPAFEYVSDVDGVVVLEGYGLQDSIPELRVLAPGFAGIKYLDEYEVLSARSSIPSSKQWDSAPAAEAICRIRLRRLPGAELRMLDESGDPLADATLMVQDGDGHHVVRTDSDGHAAIPARYGSGELTITRLRPVPGPGAYGIASASERTTFRFGGDDWPDDLPVGRVRFLWSGEGDAEPITGLQVTHTDGWFDWTDDEGWIELPAGAAYVVVDDASPNAPLGTPPVIVIADQTALVELQRQKQRPLGTLPAGLASRVVVEQGARSVEYSLDEATPFEIFVTGTEPCTLWFPEFEVSHEFDPTSELTAELIQPLRLEPQSETSLTVWTLASPQGASLGISGQDVSLVEMRADESVMTIQGPTGTPLLLHYSRDGYADRWTRTLLSAATDAPIVPELLQLASLQIEATDALTVEGVDDLADLTTLHPGPFDCVVRTADGTRIGLQLELAPGEQRVLRLE